MLTYNTRAGESRSKFIFESTDIYYTGIAAKDSRFRIIQGRAGETAWDIIIDSKSSIRGDVKSLVTLKDTYYNGILYTINNQHSVTIEEGCSILTGVEKYDTYVMCMYDPMTGDALEPVTYPAGDLRFTVSYEIITSID